MTWRYQPLAKGRQADRAMDRALEACIGMSKWDLDTPILCVDLETLERNLTFLQQAVREAGIECRPHAKAHKCPEIARRQLAVGAVGVCAATVGEAEVLVEAGVDSVLLTTPIATESKIRRAVQLRQHAGGFMMVTDTEEKARLISSVAMELGVVVDVLIDVDPGIHRTGVAPREPALALARVVDSLPGLYLRGIQCYDGLSQHVPGFEARRKQVLTQMVPIVETVDLLRQAGLNIEFVTGGGTGTYNIDHAHFTDVQCGSYAFMDAQYLAIGKADGSPVNDDFLPSLSVVTTVINTLVPEVATADAGTKSLTCDEPDPLVIGLLTSGTEPAPTSSARSATKVPVATTAPAIGSR